MAASTLDKTPILNAATLVLTPKDEFKSWLKQTALKQKIFPSQVDQKVDQGTLDQHALAFITPVMIGKNEAEKFYEKNDAHLIDLMLATWPFPLSSWPKDRSHQKLVELFDAHYYLYLINLTKQPIVKDENGECSVTTIKPKAPVKEWLDHLIEKEKIKLPNIDTMDIDTLRKLGVAVLTPYFKNKSEEMKFMQKNAEKLFSLGLSLYCNDKSLWPKDLSYPNFIEWFDCINYYPAINLMREIKR